MRLGKLLGGQGDQFISPQQEHQSLQPPSAASAPTSPRSTPPTAARKNKSARKGIQKITHQCLDLKALLCRDVISPLAFETLLTLGKNVFIKITHLHSPT